MKTVLKFGLCCSLFVAGYCLGAADFSTSTELRAQNEESGTGPSAETAAKIRTATDAIMDAQSSLENETLYTPAIQGPNAFAVLAGGVNAVADLDRGQGVDPVTFVGLYSGLETEEVAAKLGYNSEGLRTYNGRVIRLYAKTRLRQLQAAREKIASGK